MGNTHRYLMNQDFVNPHDGITYHTALQNQFKLAAPMGIKIEMQNLDFVNPYDGITYHSALQDLNAVQASAMAQRIAAAHSLQNQGFKMEGPMGMKIEMLQNMNMFDDAKKMASDAYKSIHGSVSGSVGGIEFDVKK